MATAYTLISSITVGGGGAASMEFTSIPSTYTHLAILTSQRTVSASPWGDVSVSFNSTTANLSSKWINAEGGTSVGWGGSGSAIYYWTAANSATSNTFGNGLIYIPNYAGNNVKSVSIDNVGENNAANTILVFTTGLWSDTSAITSVKLTGGSNFMQYSTAYLYGISNA